MREEINKLPIDGEIVIGEGELDKAPMLYIGERLGNRNGPRLDIAVDPVEGTNFVANNMPGGLSVLAIAEAKNLFKAPETYMDKIATGPDIPKGAIDLDYPVEKNIKIISEITGKQTSDITACILDRPRHQRIINELNKLKVNIKLISDGDVSGALLVSDKKYNVDIFLGIAVQKGFLQLQHLTRLVVIFRVDFYFTQKMKLIEQEKMGIKDLSKKYDLNEIVKGRISFFLQQE